jgi:hypothetical protein
MPHALVRAATHFGDNTKNDRQQAIQGNRTRLRCMSLSSRPWLVFRQMTVRAWAVSALGSALDDEGGAYSRHQSAWGGI